MKYHCWKSHTCWTCSGGTGIPIYHVSSIGYKPTSPCDTITRTIVANSRREAMKIYKQNLQDLRR